MVNRRRCTFTATRTRVFHILEGTMLFRVYGADILAHAGTMMAPKGVAHTFRVETAEGAHCLTITTGGDFERMVREMSIPALVRRHASPCRADAGDGAGADGVLRQKRHRHHRRAAELSPPDGRAVKTASALFHRITIFIVGPRSGHGRFSGRFSSTAARQSPCLQTGRIDEQRVPFPSLGRTRGLKSAGLYKSERVITSPQSAEIEVGRRARS